MPSSPPAPRAPLVPLAHRILITVTTTVLLLGLAAVLGVDGPAGTVRAMVTPAPDAVGSGPAAPPVLDEAAAVGPIDPATDPRVVAPVGGGATDPAAPAEPTGPTERTARTPPAQADAATVAAEPPEAAPAPWSVGVHSGLGAWADVWDWTVWGSSGAPTVTPETVDTLAAQGVRTLYLQTTRIDKPDAVMEPDRLLALIDRAHEHGMFVVGWYLPTFTDPADDLRRIEAAMALPLDGFALDIESQDVADPAERTRRLLAMSQRLRELAGDRVLVANVLPPVQMEELAPSLWPGFPWTELGEYYEVFMPMGYFTFREDGHRWRDAEAYTAENVRRIRERVGDPELPVHFIGGIADLTTVADVEGMTRGARASGAIGLSLYDVATTGTELWAPMQAWRELR